MPPQPSFEEKSQKRRVGVRVEAGGEKGYLRRTISRGGPERGVAGEVSENGAMRGREGSYEESRERGRGGGRSQWRAG